ncbi:hypothetical protein D4764_10G0002150 [Takifugu flavidus]|uniref:Uncharacterized protein n=1 Tax=Takifugu flavidus TaxID=433684 RepID=A0A5C6PII0_9TELE|nr:hypothetical protein D4764_10G0002150 [Takifugu flavidus]
MGLHTHCYTGNYHLQHEVDESETEEEEEEEEEEELRLNGARGGLGATARSDQGQAGGSRRESGGRQEQDEDGEERS